MKVLDFGISRFLGNDLDKAEVAGTPEFMAPEQITAPEAVDERADIYALGVILYEMLTARRPFDDDDQRALLHRDRLRGAAAARSRRARGSRAADR